MHITRREGRRGVSPAVADVNGHRGDLRIRQSQGAAGGGATTEVVSPKGGRIRGWNHTEWGDEVGVAKDLQSADREDYDALVLPGGVMNPDKLRTIPAAVSFAKSFFQAGKPVAAICHGPWTVIESGAARVLKPFDLGALELQVDASGRDLAQLFYLTQVTLPNSPPFRLRAHIARNGLHVAVTRIAGSLGQSDISGRVDVDASHKRPDLRADLISHHLLLKDLAAITGSEAPVNGSLAPADAKPAAPNTASSSEGIVAPRPFPDAHLQVDRMRAIAVDVHFRATSVEAGTLPITGVSLHARLDNGFLTTEPLEFDLPQGRLTGSVQIDARSDTPKVRAELRAKDIRLDELKGRGPNAVPPLDGNLQVRARIEGTGDSVQQVMSDANGELTFIVPNGDIRSAFAELTGVDVAKGIGLMLTKPDDRAPVRCGVAQFDLSSGTAHADRIVFDTQSVLITGQGQIELAPEKLDLTLQGEPKKPRLMRVRAPVDIRGQLLKPNFQIEPGHVLKQGAIAATLSALLTPIAAVLAVVDPGLAKDQNCAQLLAQARTSGPLAVSSPRPPAVSPDEKQ